MASRGKQDLVRALAEGRLSRRAFVTRAAALGLSASAVAAFLAACGGAATPTAGAGGTAPTGAPASGGATATAPAAGGAASTPAQATSPIAAGTPGANTRTGITAAEWNPEKIRAQAGTLQVDTKAAVAKVVPTDYKGKLSFWYAGPNQASPDIDKQIDKEFWDAWNATYPGIPLKVGDTVQNLDYNQMLDKVRTAAAGNAAPDVARMPILWGVEFAAKGQLAEVKLEEFGFTKDQFWSGALKSVTWQGKYYGVPTNNETMAFIWNKKVFEAAGLDPNTAPATWEDVVKFSKQIKDKTGKAGYGLVARTNAGNTPFRFMPVLWAYGSGALDEAEENPTYEKVLINNDGGIAALQLHYDMYVKDHSVPSSALTNTQTENGDLFISEQIAMEISHPSEYAAMIDKAKKATGPDKAKAQEVVDNMAYGLIPAGPVRRAVVFGGSNMHIFADKNTGHTVDRKAADAFTTFWCSPEWATKLVWDSSNPGNLDGFKTDAMKQRLEQIKFLDVTTSMLPYGIPFPVIPESTQIMNNIVPDMIQNALTQKMTVKQAADDAADKI
ncbi:MAG TPA: sugar ABC transporter substrate-binding protein, partial [Thermomicrobiales bacterium]|nr:sugar ABC transporter substrate-binding protein [Thermomicrobiales bacterium]